ncbi:MAG TPA: hypothetical protein VGL53_09420 [Bryobacteraceae bacterium]|jgi:hypothetical protein
MRFAIVLAILSIPSTAQPMPAEMREVLASEFGFSPADLSKVESGKAVARMVPTGRPDDLRMAGAVLMHVSSADFIRAFRDVEHFAAGKEVRQTGRFSSPPVEADYSTNHFSDLSKDEIFACHPGHCSYKMPAQAMEALRTGIDWNAPDSNARAEAYIHKLMIERLIAYQRDGDKTLAVYYDTPAPYSVAEGLHSLLGQETRLQSNFPDLLRYAEKYPNAKPPDTDDFFYWQDAAFGLKHVLRVQHVIISKVPRASADPHYAIISKMLFATHYFRAAMEFSYVYPVRTATGEPAIYFVAMQRSYVDGLTGVKGAILHKIAENRSPTSLAANLELARQQLETRH